MVVLLQQDYSQKVKDNRAIFTLGCKKRYIQTIINKNRQKSYMKLNPYEPPKWTLQSDYERKRIWLKSSKGIKFTQKYRYKRFLNKIRVFSYYSKNDIKCACCGERNVFFLSIDHMNNDGKKHREKIGYSRLYEDIIKSNFPEGLQILCINCNFARQIYKICPHKKIPRIS